MSDSFSSLANYTRQDISQQLLSRELLLKESFSLHLQCSHLEQKSRSSHYVPNKNDLPLDIPQLSSVLLSGLQLCRIRCQFLKFSSHPMVECTCVHSYAFCQKDETFLNHWPYYCSVWTLCSMAYEQQQYEFAGRHSKPSHSSHYRYFPI